MKRYLTAFLEALFKKRFGAFGAVWKYFRDFRRLKSAGPEKIGFRLRASYPRLTDDLGSSGPFGRYVYQDSWAFRHVLERRPARLVDIASSTYFVAFAAQATQVVSVDIRPLKAAMPSIEIVEGDITAMPFEDDSCEALSTLSVIEHIGLGRYGDSLDLHGMQKAADELRRILKPGGMLLVAFPVGAANSIEFNAHRILTPETVFEMFVGLKLEEEQYALSDRILPRTDYEKLARPYSYGCYRFTK